MNIIGLSAFYHESACCLLQGGKLVAAAAEERFTRVKHDARLPVNAFRYCLAAGCVDLTDIDCLAYYEQPTEKLSRQLWSNLPVGGASDAGWLDPERAERAIRERLGYEGPIRCFGHHESHAASAFFYSGFYAASILTVDGVGEWATTTYGSGAGTSIEVFEEVHFPHSLGLLYAAITSYLGFRVNSGEYKVMGLAAYGRPKFVRQMRKLITSRSDGQFVLSMPFFDFVNGSQMYTDALCDLVGVPARQPESEFKSTHCDVARSLQEVLEEVLLEKVAYLHERIPNDNLCLAGGVALNCVANGRIVREGPFKSVFIQPAAGDAGACLGAAALAHIQLVDSTGAVSTMDHVFLGPSYAAAEVASLLGDSSVAASDYRGKEAELIERTTDLLLENKIVGWFQGCMEFGPRALGARSILANPMGTDIQNRLNTMVKRREDFRPFAPSVLVSEASGHFDLNGPSPYMLQTCRVTSPLELPAVTHVDGSARPQTVDSIHHPRFAALLEMFFRRTGCPMLLNTSFNIREEPIVCSPADALMCMVKSGLDALVLEDFLVLRDDLPENLGKLVETWTQDRRQTGPPAQTPLRENLYTFV